MFLRRFFSNGIKVASGLARFSTGQPRPDAASSPLTDMVKRPKVTDAHSDLNALLAQVAIGNRVAFEALYDATSAKLLGVCIRVLKDRDTAEDAMQEAYVKIWKAADRYRVTGHSPMTWLITIARNTAVDRMRARKVHEDIADHEYGLVSRAPGPETAVIAASEAERIMTCLEELGADRREAIRGAYLDGQSYKDLSERFGVPLNTMRTWLRRGLAALKECMAQ